MHESTTGRGLLSTAAVGTGALAASGALAVALLGIEMEVARRTIGEEPGPGYADDGRYGAGAGQPYRMLLLGDSIAAGVGAGSPANTIGAIVATGVAALSGRPVELRNVSRSGAVSAKLPGQVRRGLAAAPDTDVAVIMIGANDVKERVPREVAAGHLRDAVLRLREAGAEVVVGTCPDLGTVRPVLQPLRTLMQRWSRQLAEAQTVAVVESGGRAVSTGDLLGAAFREAPLELFSDDRLHPSAAGYATAAAALLPSVLDALQLPTADSGRAPDYLRGERVEPLQQVAHRSVRDPGTEVSGAEVEGRGWSDLGRWARLLRRHRPGAAPTPETAPTGELDSDGTPSPSLEEPWPRPSSSPPPAPPSVGPSRAR
ncbi:SGNH/GDSL hydrolase family protein [Ornithinicoccus halotolerans]|uniref:SGNH/GDSL hydrolase family protein n=1 Tax=Ornithinicoccus halotolerans TaxID=1748220 RepID=UPI001297765F|nr:SGNH/GDSL hydrolase family protein [Ornithinicoccus halotolerans]